MYIQTHTNTHWRALITDLQKSKFNIFGILRSSGLFINFKV